jgi:hypothetical protein
MSSAPPVSWLRLAMGVACCSLLVTSAQGREATLLSVCQILKAPYPMEGIKVRVHARYWVDPHHGTFLADESCHGDILGVDFTLERAHRSVRKLDEAVRNLLPTLWDIEVTGIVERSVRAGEVQTNGIAEPKFLIRVTRVWTFAQWPLERRSPPNKSLERTRER